MNTEDARKLAEAHWGYTEKIILKMLELTHVAYVEAMVHGIKHGENEILTSGLVGTVKK